MESTEIYDCLLLFPQIGVCGLNCKHCWVTDNLKSINHSKKLRE